MRVKSIMMYWPNIILAELAIEPAGALDKTYAPRALSSISSPSTGAYIVVIYIIVVAVGTAAVSYVPLGYE